MDKVIQFYFYFHTLYQNKKLKTMKPFHHLFITAFKDALIVVAAFTFYELIEELKNMWKVRYPESMNLHDHYGRLLHLTSIFVADFAIGCIIYYLFHIT